MIWYGIHQFFWLEIMLIDGNAREQIKVGFLSSYFGAMLLLLLSNTALSESPNCDLESVRCIGPGQEYDTEGVDHVETAFQAAANKAQPGDFIAIAGGTYVHKLSSPTLIFLEMSKSGSADAPIRISNFPDEDVKFVGFGYPEGTDGPERNDQTLLKLSGDFIHVSGLELEYSSRFGILITGSKNVVEEVRVHDSWQSNIVVMGTDPNPAAANVIRFTETYRSRHGNGIWIVISSQGKQPVTDTRIEFNLAFDNGREPDNDVVPAVAGDPAGGGNSDGIAAFKSCHDDAPLVNMANMCPRTVIRGNVVWSNADDGFDFSVGEGSVVMQNISIANGPEGNTGFKMLRHVAGGIKFVGNLSVANLSNGIEIRADDRGIVANNASLSNGLHGLNVSMTNPIPSESKALNNLSAFNKGSKAFEFLMEGMIEANWNANESGSPGLFNEEYAPTQISNAGGEGNIQAKWRNIWTDLAVAYTPTVQSPLIDTGVFDPAVHCDLPSNESELLPHPDDPLCLKWSGTKPDIGPFESGFSMIRPKPPASLN